MQMRMVKQILSPGVQHREEADFHSEMLWIARNRSQRFGRGTKQNVVNHFPVVICDARELFRNGEDNVKVFHRQQLRLARFHHFALFQLMTFGQWRLRHEL